MGKVYDKTYTSLNVWVSRDENAHAYVFGVTFAGIDVPFASRKLGGIDTDLIDAQQAQQQQQATATAPAVEPSSSDQVTAAEPSAAMPQPDTSQPASGSA